MASIAEKNRLAEILRILRAHYPEAHCSLHFQSPYELLVSTILAAQCTDARVNLVTPGLFKKFPDVFAMAKGTLPEIEALISSTGFFRNKARFILQTSQILVRDYQGKVPSQLDLLVALPGVGRKTANVVLGVAYGIPGLVVDTHVGRLTQRLGFSSSKNPIQIEKDLMDCVPVQDWVDYGHLLIDHGRAICTSRKAHCGECPLGRLCPKLGIKSAQWEELC